MTKKELYTCDVCHTDYMEKCHALACEKGHVMINYTKEPEYRAREKYPDKITVKFEDNKEIIYKR